MVKMIEKIARTLALVEGAKMIAPGQDRAMKEFGWRGDAGHSSQYVERHWKEHVHAAGFVLDAISEPTEAMHIAGMNTPDGSPLTAWRLMIEAAQKE